MKQTIPMLALISFVTFAADASASCRTLALLVKSMRPSVMGKVPQTAELTEKLNSKIKGPKSFRTVLADLEKIANSPKHDMELRDLAARKIFDLLLDQAYMQQVDLPRVVAVTKKEDRRKLPKDPEKKKLIELPAQLPTPNFKKVLDQTALGISELDKIHKKSPNVETQSLSLAAKEIYQTLNAVEVAMAERGNTTDQLAAIDKVMRNIPVQQREYDEVLGKQMLRWHLGWAYVLKRDAPNKAVRSFADEIYAWLFDSITQQNFESLSHGGRIDFKGMVNEDLETVTGYRVTEKGPEDTFEGNMPASPSELSTARRPAIKRKLGQ